LRITYASSILALLFSALLSFSLSAQTIIYETSGGLGERVSLPATSVPGGFTATDVTRVNLTPRNGNNTFNSRSWQPNSTSPAGGPSYLEWEIDFGGSSHTISSMDIGYRRSNRGPQDIELQASVDAGTTWITLLVQTGITVTTNRRTGVGAATAIDTSLVPATSGTVMFRFFGSASDRASGTFRIRDVSGDPAITIVAAPANLPVISASKIVRILSSDGTSCTDFAVSPPAGPSPAAIPGACVDFLIEIENTGTADASRFNVSDTLPGSFTFIAAQRSGWDETSPAPNPFSFSTPAAATDCGATACEILIENGVVADGTSAFVQVRAILK
jgi:uncharacterized repeat protein (TIGR01451 family)